MKNILHLLFVLLLFQNCFNNTLDNEKKTDENNISKQKEINCFDSTIVFKPLIKKLIKFTKEVDSIPNPFNEDIVYSISFYTENGDTVIDISASIFAPLIVPKLEKKYELKGALKCENIVVVIYDYEENVGSKLYDENRLKYYKFKEIADSIYSWTFVPPNILLKFTDSMLVTLEDNSGKGKFDFFK